MLIRHSTVGHRKVSIARASIEGFVCTGKTVGKIGEVGEMGERELVLVVSVRCARNET